jgi:hypothetical protein
MSADEFARATHPIAIVQARYWGCWVAVPKADAALNDGVSPLDEGVWDDDIEAFDWLDKNRDRIGLGDTPEQAHAELKQKWGVE